MRNFTLSVYTRTYERIITQFDNSMPNKHNNPFGTFAETLVENENDQFTLDFSIAGYVLEDGRIVPNYWKDMLKIGSRLKLLVDDETLQVNLIITKITPTIGIDNIIYKMSAQDEVSYLWAKHRLGYSYSNIDAGVETIYQIARNILRDNFLASVWSVRDTESIVDENENIQPLRNKPITHEVEDSNPYNAILEACTTLNCCMRVNYAQRYITFYQKERISFSGYRYRPEVNLTSFSADYSANDMTTMMHVVGGEDAYGCAITFVPAMPSAIIQTILDKYSEQDLDSFEGTQLWIELENMHNNRTLKYLSNDTDSKARETENKEITTFLSIAKQVPHLGQFIWNNEYFNSSHSRLMSEAVYQEMDYQINTKMRNNNIYLKYLTPRYYNDMWEIRQMLEEAVTNASTYIGEARNIQQKIADATAGAKKDEVITLSQEVFTSIQDSITQMSQIEQKIRNSFSRNTYQLFEYLFEVYGKPADKFSLTQWIETIEEVKEWREKEKYALEQKTESKQFIDSISYELETNYPNGQDNTGLPDYKYRDLESKLAMYKTRYNSAETICAEGWTITQGDFTLTVEGIYNLVISILLECAKKAFDLVAVSMNITELINNYTQKNDAIWAYLYNNYGEYIYESKYENSDELDSVALYNQGIAYFLSKKFPVPSYSLTAIDIGALELVGIPRLTIGSKIRVYEKNLNLADNEKDIISYNDNVLITTSLTYDLRNAAKVTVSVEKVNAYQTILQKLLISIA